MQARKLPARAGIVWLKSAFALYRKNPPLLTSITMLYLMVAVGLNFIPYLGAFIVPLLLPTLNLIIGNTCRLIDLGMQPSRDLLFAHVREQRPQLIRLGFMQLGGSVLLLCVMLLIGTDASAGKAEIEDIAAMLLRMFLLAVPLLLAFWFAPLLTGWDGVPAGKAVFFSAVASWRNLGAFLGYVFGIVIFAILLPGLVLVLASLIAPGLVGGLSFILRTVLIVVVTPILMAGAYVSYQAVFHLSEQAE